MAGAGIKQLLPHQLGELEIGGGVGVLVVGGWGSVVDGCRTRHATSSRDKHGRACKNEHGLRTAGGGTIVTCIAF